MAYSSFDFDESVSRAAAEGLERDNIRHVMAAWGGSPEGGGSWDGGFVLELKDGRWAYLTGWCDYTGWGCQDGISIEFFDKAPDWRKFTKSDGKDDGGDSYDWDEDPVDLNRSLSGEAEQMDKPV